MARQDHGHDDGSIGEDSLIQRHFRPLAADFPGARNLQDDAASIAPPEGCDLVVTTDALVAGVHFLADDDPADIAFKALAVNVSDLAAKAAEPIAYSLALILPRGTPQTWLAGFAAGLGEAQTAFSIAMSGGDTAVSPAGPLMISITAFGGVPRGRMVPRGGASAGDGLYVSGTIGDGALGLLLRRDDDGVANWPIEEAERLALISRYLRPAPRLGLRKALLAHAAAAMDVSDGLAIDCGRLCKVSGVSARIEAALVPLSAPARSVVAADPARLETVLTGGDDYEILAAIPPGSEEAFRREANAAGVPVTRIGGLSEGEGVVVFIGATGEPLPLARLGYDHLAP
jgi:thiamine-monophosphate kinase